MISATDKLEDLDPHVPSYLHMKGKCTNMMVRKCGREGVHGNNTLDMCIY